MNNRFSFAASRLAVDKIEDGAFCHWTDPGTGDLLYLPDAKREDGTMDPAKAVGAFVRSQSSRVYKAHLEDVQRRAVKGNRRAKNDTVKEELLIKQLKEEEPQTFTVLVRAFQNTAIDYPGEWVASEDEKLAIANDPHNSHYLKLCLDFSADGTNYGIEETKTGNAVAA